MRDNPHALRRQLLELGFIVHRLHQAGRDSAAAQLLLARKRAELEDVMGRNKDALLRANARCGVNRPA